MAVTTQTFSSSPHSTGSMHIHSHMGICASLRPQTTHGLHESHPSQLQNRDRIRDLGETSALWLNHLPACWATPSFPLQEILQFHFPALLFLFQLSHLPVGAHAGSYSFEFQLSHSKIFIFSSHTTNYHLQHQPLLFCPKSLFMDAP